MDYRGWDKGSDGVKEKTFISVIRGNAFFQKDSSEMRVKFLEAGNPFQVLAFKGFGEARLSKPGLFWSGGYTRTMKMRRR